MPRYEINHYVAQRVTTRPERDDREIVEANSAREALAASAEAHEREWPVKVRDDDFASATDPETGRDYERSIIAERIEEPTSLFDRRVPQPGDYDDYGVPPDVRETVKALYLRRNRCTEDEVEAIDAEILRVLEPYTRD